MLYVEAGEGPHRVRLTIETTRGNGIFALLTGGERPHVGGVAVAVPRAKSSGEGLTCDVSQICVPGHKDVYAAAVAAKALAIGTGEVTSVTAGIHMEHASSEDIAKIMDNVRETANALLESI